MKRLLLIRELVNETSFEFEKLVGCKINEYILKIYKQSNKILDLYNTRMIDKL